MNTDISWLLPNQREIKQKVITEFPRAFNNPFLHSVPNNVSFTSDTLSLTTDPILQIASKDPAFQEYLKEIKRRNDNKDLLTNPLLMESDKTKFTQESLKQKKLDLEKRIDNYLKALTSTLKNLGKDDPLQPFLTRLEEKFKTIKKTITSISVNENFQQAGYELTLLNRAISSSIFDLKEAKKVINRGGSINVTDQSAEMQKLKNKDNIYEVLIKGIYVFYSDQEKGKPQADKRKAKIEKAIIEFNKIDPLKLLQTDALKQGEQQILIAVDINEKIIQPGTFAGNNLISTKEDKKQTVGIYFNKYDFDKASDSELIAMIANEVFDTNATYLKKIKPNVYSEDFLSSKEYQSLGKLYEFKIRNYGKNLKQEDFAKAFAEYLPLYFTVYNHSKEQKEELNILTSSLTGGEFKLFDDLYRSSAKYFHQAY